ncbi:hypothetical protein QUB75_17835 [Microcoleus sp. K1-B6]|uniref:hypothetical protein n=1 Tax=unclassified Microcoleus TaxID=2642155 RepID=UPI002FCF4607
MGHWEFDLCKTGSDRTSNLEKIGNFGHEQSTGFNRWMLSQQVKREVRQRIGKGEFNGWMLSQQVKREDFSHSPPLPLSHSPLPFPKNNLSPEIAAIGKKTARLPYRKH